MGRPVIHTSLPYILSASQINLFRECKRKYALQYVAGIKTPQTPSQALGTEVDDNQLQPYLSTGRLPDDSQAGQIAKAGLHHLPAPKSPGIEVQKQFLIPSPTVKLDDGSPALGYLGYLDLWVPDGMYMPGLPAGCEGNPCVSDFKTTKSFRYAKGAKDLAVDVQAQLYATWAMFETRKKHVDLVWLYFLTTDTPKTKRSHLRVDKDHVYGQFLEIEKTAKQVVELRQEAETQRSAPGFDAVEYALSLEPNIDACDGFGGCPHRFRCNIGPADQIATMTKTTKEDIDVSTDDLFAKIKARKAAALGQAAPTPTVVEETVPEVLTKPYQAKSPAGAAFLGINPPEKDLPPQVEAVQPPPAVVDAAPAADASAAGVSTTAGDAPKKRGRPAGSKNKAKLPSPEEVIASVGEEAAKVFEAGVALSAEQVIEQMIEEDAVTKQPDALSSALFSLAAKLSACANQLVEVAAIVKGRGKEAA